MNNLEKCKQEYINKYYEKKLVFGDGVVNAKIMLIGEAPGANEEEQGKPFVGKAGKNLNEFLEILGLQREDIYITNVVKLRPTKLSAKTEKYINRPPSVIEIDDFLPLLKLEINEVHPTLIVTLGNVPLKAVIGNKNATIGGMHGEITEIDGGIRLFPLYHPAAVIYNQGLRLTYINDLEKLKAYLL